MDTIIPGPTNFAYLTKMFFNRVDMEKIVKMGRGNFEVQLGECGTHRLVDETIMHAIGAGELRRRSVAVENRYYY